MALINNWDEAGSGIVISSTASSRNYTINGDEGYYETIHEETRNEVTRWVALTKEAAQDAVARNVQPTDDPDATHSWTLSLNSIVIRDYTVERAYSKTTTRLVDFSGDVPVPTFSPEGTNVTGTRLTQPHFVTIACSASTAKIEYQLYYKNGTGTTAYWTKYDEGTSVGASINKTVDSDKDGDSTTLNPRNTITNNASERVIKIWARAVVEVEGVKKYSGWAWAEYQDTLTTPNIHYDDFTVTGPYNETWTLHNVRADDPSASFWYRIWMDGMSVPETWTYLGNTHNTDYSRAIPTKWPDGKHHIQFRTMVGQYLGGSVGFDFTTR